MRTMKSTVVHGKWEEMGYPKLRKTSHSGMVVLFTNEHTGTVVHLGEPSSGAYSLGQWAENWNPKNFGDLPADDVVELRN